LRIGLVIGHRGEICFSHDDVLPPPVIPPPASFVHALRVGLIRTSPEYEVDIGKEHYQVWMMTAWPDPRRKEMKEIGPR